MDNTKSVDRLSIANDQTLLSLTKWEVKINILCVGSKKTLNSTFWLTKYGVKSKRQKRARRQNENIPSYRSLSVSNGGWCYSNRTVIKASISSHLCALCLKTHAHKHTLAHTCRESQKCFVPPAHFKSIKGCACVYTCVCLGGGVKIILNYTFVTWKAFCLLCMSSSSLINSAILTFQLLIIHQTSTLHCLFLSMSSPISFSSFIPLVLDIFQALHFSVLMYACQIQ